MEAVRARPGSPHRRRRDCRRSFPLRLQPDLDCLSRQPFCSKAFVVCMEFWLGLAVRYRLPRRKRMESPSLELVRNLLLGRSLRLDHLLFPFSPSSTSRRIASGRDGFGFGCSLIQASIGSISAGGMRTITGTAYTGGRPMRFFLISETVDFFMSI